MSFEVTRSFFGWCTLLNSGLLLSWALMFWFAHDWIYRYHSRAFRLSVETFDAIHYGGMAIYKVGIFLLNLVPYLALWAAQ